MTRIIQLEHEYNAEHLLGKYLDHDAYDLVINEDCDVYKPLKFGQVQDEHTVLLKFRKHAFSDQDCDATFQGLISGATLTDNRGLAAGVERQNPFQTLPNGQGARRWVTKREKAVIEYFALGSPPSLYGDRAEEIYRETPNTPLEGRGGGVVADCVSIKGGSIWIVKLAHEVNFDSWYYDTVQLNPTLRKKAAIELYEKYISDTTYGEGAYSGVGGSMDRYPRIPFCRQTAWTAANREKFEMALPLMECASGIFKSELPIRYAGQMDAASKLDAEFRIGQTPYTTVTINKSFRTACHRDAGDLCDDGTQAVPRGFSSLTVVTNGKDFDGFYLCFPQYRVACNVKNGDFIMMDAHKIHGNVPLISSDPGFERLSLVFYYREAMSECGSAAYEEARRDFVYSRKGIASHNGVTPGMFQTQEWFDFLESRGLN